MSFIFYKSALNEKAGFNLQDLKFEDIVTGKYFFVPSKGDFLVDPLYTTQEIELIGYITDKEYYLVVTKLVDAPYLLKLKDYLSSRISELQNKIDDFDKYKSYKEKLDKINIEIQEIESNIFALNNMSIENLNFKTIAQKYNHLLVLDLDKIYNDFINLNLQINQLEAEYLDLKSKEISFKKQKFVYDKGLISLLIGSGIGLIALIFLIFSLFNINLIFQLIISFTIIILFFALFMLFKRKDISIDFNEYEEKIKEIENKIITLKRKKKVLLEITKFGNESEFYIVKAKIKTFEKILNNIVKDGNKVNLLNNVRLFEQRLEILKKEQKLLASDLEKLNYIEQLNIENTKKDLQYIKNDFELLNNVLNLDNNYAYDYLSSIKKEFVDVFKKYRLSEYSKLQKDSVQISNYIKDLCSKFGIDNFNLNDLKILTMSHRLIFFLSFAKISIGLNNLTLIINSSDFSEVSFFDDLLKYFQQENNSLSIILIK